MLCLRNVLNPSFAATAARMGLLVKYVHVITMSSSLRNI